MGLRFVDDGLGAGMALTILGFIVVLSWQERPHGHARRHRWNAVIIGLVPYDSTAVASTIVDPLEALRGSGTRVVMSAEAARYEHGG